MSLPNIFANKAAFNFPNLHDQAIAEQFLMNEYRKLAMLTEESKERNQPTHSSSFKIDDILSKRKNEQSNSPGLPNTKPNDLKSSFLNCSNQFQNQDCKAPFMAPEFLLHQRSLSDVELAHMIAPNLNTTNTNNLIASLNAGNEQQRVIREFQKDYLLNSNSPVSLNELTETTNDKKKSKNKSLQNLNKKKLPKKEKIYDCCSSI